MCMAVLPRRVSVHCLHAWCPGKLEKVIGSSGTVVTNGCEAVMGVLGIESRLS